MVKRINNLFYGVIFCNNYKYHQKHYHKKFILKKFLYMTYKKYYLKQEKTLKTIYQKAVNIHQLIILFFKVYIEQFINKYIQTIYY